MRVVCVGEWRCGGCRGGVDCGGVWGTLGCCGAPFVAILPSLAFMGGDGCGSHLLPNPFPLRVPHSLKLPSSQLRIDPSPSSQKEAGHSTFRITLSGTGCHPLSASGARCCRSSFSPTTPPPGGLYRTVRRTYACPPSVVPSHSMHR